MLTGIDTIAYKSTKCMIWWRHQMETFSALLAICAGNSPATGEFPTQRPVTRSFDVFFDQHLNKRLGKQSRGWWFETPSHPLWRHCNGRHFVTDELNKNRRWLWKLDSKNHFHQTLSINSEIRANLDIGDNVRFNFRSCCHFFDPVDKYSCTITHLIALS